MFNFDANHSHTLEWKESIIYDDVDQIGINEAPEHFTGYVKIRFWILQDITKRTTSEVIRGLTTSKKSLIIYTKDSAPIKENDIVRLWGREIYTVQEVKRAIDPKFEQLVSMFPNAREKYSVKIITLG